MSCHNRECQKYNRTEKHHPALGIRFSTRKRWKICINPYKKGWVYHGLLPEYQDSETLPTPAIWTRALTRHTYNSIIFSNNEQDYQKRTVSATSAFRKSIWRSPLGMRVIWFTSPKDYHRDESACFPCSVCEAYKPRTTFGPLPDVPGHPWLCHSR